jgi:hypothetical protein
MQIILLLPRSLREPHILARMRAPGTGHCACTRKTKRPADSGCRPSFLLRLDSSHIQPRTNLPVSAAAMSASTTVEPTSAMRRAPAVEPATAANCATVESTSRAARKSAPARKATAACKPAPAYEPTSAYETASAYETTTAPTATTPTAAPAIPRTGTYKQSARKPVRSVEAVRRAGVRIISIVAVRAYRLYANSDRDLRLRIGQRQHQNRHQSQIFHIPHVVPPCLRSVVPTSKPIGSRSSRPCFYPKRLYI